MEAEDTIQKDDDNGLRSVFAQKVELVTRVDLLNEGAKTYLASATSPYPNSVAHGQMSSSYSTLQANPSCGGITLSPDKNCIASALKAAAMLKAYHEFLDCQLYQTSCFILTVWHHKKIEKAIE